MMNLEAVKEFLLEAVRTNFERDGYLAPVVFVVPTQEPDGSPPKQAIHIMDVSQLMVNEAGKEILSEIIRQIAEQTKASLVAMVTENWTLPSGHPALESMEACLAEYKKYGGSLANHPDRTEQVSVNIESRDGCKVFTAEIKRKNPEDEHPELGEWETTMDDNSRSQGRFVGFLPPEDGAN